MIVDTACYGLCLFSYDKLNSFLIYHKKTRTRKLLDFFQKNQEIYIQSLRNGVWIPISSINSIGYEIKIINNEENMNNINKIFHYGYFNLDVTDNYIWVCDIGKFLNFDKEGFKEKNELFYYTLDGKKIINAVKFSIPSGKYFVSIIGSVENDIPCFSFKFDAIEDFIGFNDPREDDKYPFSFD